MVFHPVQKANLDAVVKASGNTIQPFWASLYAKLLEEKDIDDILLKPGAWSFPCQRPRDGPEGGSCWWPLGHPEMPSCPPPISSSCPAFDIPFVSICVIDVQELVIWCTHVQEWEARSWLVVLLPAERPLEPPRPRRRRRRVRKRRRMSEVAVTCSEARTRTTTMIRTKLRPYERCLSSLNSAGRLLEHSHLPGRTRGREARS